MREVKKVNNSQRQLKSSEKVFHINYKFTASGKMIRKGAD